MNRPMLIVDGYNVIHDWPELMRLADGQGLSAARDALVAMMADFSGFAHEEVVVVFDAYQTDRLKLTDEQQSGIRVVFTRKGETADHFIERTVDALDTRHRLVRVATSDAVEQTVALGRGAVRMSARELQHEVQQARKARDGVMAQRRRVKPHTLGQVLSAETLARIQQMIEEKEEE